MTFRMLGPDMGIIFRRSSKFRDALFLYFGDPESGSPGFPIDFNRIKKLKPGEEYVVREIEESTP